MEIKDERCYESNVEIGSQVASVEQDWRSSITSSVREKRRILEEARLRVEALEQKQNLERLQEEEEEEAEFKKRELEIAEERERSKAE